MGFAKFMASNVGRGIRIIAGIILLIVAFTMLSGIASYSLAAVALVPLLAGLFDSCVFAPLFGGSFKGSEARNSN